MKHRNYMLATALALPLAFGAADARAADIVQTLQEQDQFSQLAQAIETAGVQDALQGEGPFTVFAPTNEAFEQLPQGALDQLDEQQLRTLLQHHVMEGEQIASDEIPERLEPMAGGPIMVSLAQGEVVLQSGQQQQAAAQTGGQAGQQGQQQATAAAGQQGGAQGQQQAGRATVVAGDIEADNGVIHGIDRVLVPQELEQQLTQAQGQQQRQQRQGGQQQGQQGQGAQQ